MKNNKKKKKVLKVLGLVGLFILVFGLSYALFRITLTGKKKTKITTANFGITLTDINGNEEEEGIAVNLDKAVPEEDSEGLKREGYKFVVTNTGNVPASYELKIDSAGTLSEECIKYNLVEKDYLKKSDGTYYMGGIYDNEKKWNRSLGEFSDVPLLSSISNDTLDKTTLLPGEKIEYELKLWVKEDATVDEASNKTYEANVVVDGYQAKEYVSGKTGDTAKYTLYKDGTLAITGSGEVENINMDDFTAANNLGPMVDIIYNISQKNNISLPDINGIAIFGEASTGYSLLGIANIISGGSLNANGVDDSSYLEEMYKSSLGEETYNNLIAALANEIHITRIVIDEGITSLSEAALCAGDYMISYSSTIESFGPLVGSLSYGLVIPETISDASSIPQLENGRVRSIVFNNTQKIGNIDFYGKKLLIPNSVQTINKIDIYSNDSNIEINIDNTREYVEANWGSNWLYDHGHNVTVNYLR